MPVGKQGFVKIRNEGLGGGIRHRAYTKQRDTVRGGGLGHPASLHFHGGRSARPQNGLFAGGLSYVADGR